MKTIDLANLTINKAHTAMKNGDFSAVDLAQAYLDVISKKNKEINAYLIQDPKDDVAWILKTALYARKKRKKGK